MESRRVRTALLAALTLVAILFALGASSAAGRPTHWMSVANLGSSAVVDQDTAGILTTADGDLHLAWLRPQAGDGTYGYGLATISRSGKLLARGTALSGWDALGPDPRLVHNRARLRLIFEGNTGTVGCHANGGVFTATSAHGRRWRLRPGSMSYATTPGINGLAATAEPDGTPVAAFEGGDLFHIGVDPSCPASRPDGALTPPLASSQSDPTLVTASDGSVWLGWLQSGPNSRTFAASYWVEQILPTQGSPIEVPSSSTGIDPLSRNQPVALAARSRGGVYIAYWAADSSRSVHVELWRVGSPRPLTVPGSASRATYWAVTLTEAPGGRLAVAWATGDLKHWKIHAARTNPSASSFGPVRTINAPRSTAWIATIEAAATSRRLNVVVNDDEAIAPSQLFYTQLGF